MSVLLPLPEHVMEPLERLNRVYFSDPGRTVEFAQGELIVQQNEECHRLYLVLEGELVAYRQAENVPGTELPGEIATRKHEVFRAEPGSYVCVQAFFSRAYRSSNEIVAVTDVRLAYVDDTTEAVDVEQYGSFEHQFIPVLVHELAARNMRIFVHATAKEEAQRLLHRSEMAATLGQLSAGIAHELNNAVGVITRRTEFVAEHLEKFLAEDNKFNSQLFRYGYDDTNFTAASELRAIARKWERELNLPQPAAKVLAHIIPDTKTLVKFGPDFVKHVRNNYSFWELGHDMRDLQVAAKHATGIVRAVKLLGGGNSTRQEGIDVRESVNDAMNLLTNKLKHITVETDLTPCPLLTADLTELVQIWTNIINNAYDAMMQAHTPTPTVRIATAAFHAEGHNLLPTEYVRVSISNNGPPIPNEIHEKIFNPNFTTKKLGLDFGLGLGLSIVRRLVDSYNGTIELISNETETTFIINLPTTQIYGNN
ncbi:MAG: cyclic nucleotide-binding domain-containing protein [Akkermansia sp.]|nr:cyclic nucleotide-binding domain-containing protein [Akkermansia sp.]